MRTFIRYNDRGQILSVLKATTMPEGLEHPFFLSDEREGVIELDGSDPAAALDSLEIQEAYAVDVKEKRLVKKPPEEAKPQ